jgi:hypothetical protein
MQPSRPYEFNPYIVSDDKPTPIRFPPHLGALKQLEDPRIGREFDDFMPHGTMPPYMRDRWGEGLTQLGSWPRPSPMPQTTDPRLSPAAPEFKPRF